MTVESTNAVYRLRRRRLKRAITTGITLLFLCVSGYAGYTLANADLFDIREITVRGNSTASREEIIALSGFRIGANILRVPQERAHAGILAHPYVKEAELSWVFPNKITIEVVERKPAVVLLVDGRYLLLDDAGYCLTEVSEVGAANWALPLVLGGAKVGSLQPGDQAVDKGIQAALALIKRLDPFFMENIREFDAPSAERLAVVNADGLRILFGPPEDLDRKLQNYEDLLIKNAEKCNADTLQYVDLRYDTQITLNWK